jgi:hypothetical protein
MQYLVESTHQPNFAQQAYFTKVRQVWLLTPVILATQEAEIRRIMVRSQSRQVVHETLGRKYPSQKGLTK